MIKPIERSMVRRACLWILLPCCAVAWAGSQSEQDDREELIRRFRGDEEDIMARIIRRMAASEQAMIDRFDVSEQTLDMQDQVLKDLDTAIAQAKQNLKKQKSSASPGTDDQQEGQVDEQSQDQQEQSAESGNTAATSGGRGEAKTDVDTQGALNERRRQWGNLPPRERHEIMQGVHEDIVQRHKAHIDRYYEALAEPDEE